MANQLHWADQTAEKIIREVGEKEEYTCASGITPSGTVHIGNFREIISVDLVVRALKKLGKKVRFIYSWDDYDVFRKVPLNMPKPEVLEQYLRYPITSTPDTFGRDESYARHHEVDVETMLPIVGIKPEYLYQSKKYQNGDYALGMKKALDNRQKLKEILNTYRDAEHKITEDYYPVSVFCSCCHKDTTKIEDWDGDWNLTYSCECGNKETLDLRKAKNVKLGWRVDWPMRWAYEKVVFEPAGKDHHSQGGSFDTARLVSESIYDWKAPISFRYDFIGLKGLPGKMSSSKGKVVSLEDVLEVYQPEVLRYLFASTRPNTEFVISFDLDVIKIYEDYDKTERIAWKLQEAKNEETFQKEYRIYELSQVADMPSMPSYQIPFRHLCNLLQVQAGNIEAVLASLPDLKEEQRERLEQRAKCAWNWIRESGAPEEFKFSLNEPESVPSVEEDFVPAVKKIKDEIIPTLDSLDEKTLSTMLYDVANSFDKEPKALFTVLYKILINKEQGPRLAGFMKIIGKEKLMSLFAKF